MRSAPLSWKLTRRSYMKAKGKTLRQIAKEQGIKSTTLNSRLWHSGIEQSAYVTIKGVLYRVFNEGAEQRILDYLKKNPIRPKAGAPRKKERTAP